MRLLLLLVLGLGSFAARADEPVSIYGGPSAAWPIWITVRPGCTLRVDAMHDPLLSFSGGNCYDIRISGLNLR